MIQLSLPEAEQSAFRSWLKTQGDKHVDRCRNLVVRFAEMHVREAKERAPVRTGLLRRSITALYTADRLGSLQKVEAAYGYFQEFKAKGKVEGTYYPVPFTPPGRHFFYPPFERVKKAFLKELEKLGFRR